jgi:hypothetical protein
MDSVIAHSTVQVSIPASTEVKAPVDSFLSPIEIDELNDPLGPRASINNDCCSDEGFLAMPTAAYLELLVWTARQIVRGKRGATPEDAPPLLDRLKIKPAVWFELVTQFGRLFSLVAGQPHRVDDFRSRFRKKRYYVPRIVKCQRVFQTSVAFSIWSNLPTSLRWLRHCRCI